MRIRTSAVRFVLCECRAHGTFRNAQGEEGPDIASKREAVKTIDLLLWTGRISTEEVEELNRLVQSSVMAPTDEDVPGPLMRKVRDWTLMRAAANGQLPFRTFHATLDEPGPI